MNHPSSILSDLMAVIVSRKGARPDASYTSQLMEGGVERIGEKVREEAAELVDAAREGTTGAAKQHLTHEAADLLYHLFVMLAFRDITLSDVEAELARRSGISGFDEKAARGQTSTGNDP